MRAVGLPVASPEMDFSTSEPAWKKEPLKYKNFPKLPVLRAISLQWLPARLESSDTVKRCVGNGIIQAEGGSAEVLLDSVYVFHLDDFFRQLKEIEFMRVLSRVVATVVAIASISCFSSAKAGVLGGTFLPLDTAASSLNLQLTLNGGNVLTPPVQAIPLASGGINLDVGVGQISNISGLLADGQGIYVTSPWNIITLFGPLALSNGHLSVGVGPGPYAVSGTSVDLSGMAVSLDSGTGSLLGSPFDFSSPPVNFALPNPTIATFQDFGGGLYSLSIPVLANGTGSALGQPLTYTISGQVVFSNVPEPSALSLLAMSGLALVARRRR